ncbi:MAG TPA: (2Fe-2S) ferredoxin domain-containing protein [Acetivibrio sp.]|uniref:(2Fe-2S) ferredoxin domain-containing protein n=1 Tax=Acetivibrio sp. TaxID=1872092 RepID=UPI002C335739|nr:(2Fe-2S) ferredoxin domain-containing protein [Acetivibrio sp.]HOM02901.1 (2Fe-2S) ferredoxin domain-containing protein [Acetivibrio sp.]
MKVSICIGSSCHLKGAKQIVEQLQSLVADNNLQDQIELVGSFCMKNCVNGVSVTIDDKLFSVTPENLKSFFETEILKGFKE